MSERLVGPDSGDWDAIRAAEDVYQSGVYGKRPLALVRGEGARVWDAEGREYVDCVGAQGAANLGHCHPAVVEAVRRQAGRLFLCTEAFYNDQRARLYERLVGLAPEGLDRAFLCSSGAEANEAALKLARLATGRAGIVAAKRGFHGRTLGVLSATWERRYREPFEPLVPGVSHVAFDDLAALDAAVGEETACVILEVVQGEGGVHPASAEYLRGAAELCRDRGALLVLDEVQTGLGRTGARFACEHSGVVPDLLTLAKSLGGGLPMGAVLLGGRVEGVKVGVHGTTFGGNPLACAAATAALDALEAEDLAGRARDEGAHFLDRLRALDAPQVREVRGLGLMVGVELKVRVTPVLKALMERGVLALPAGKTVLRFLPPLVIGREDLDAVVEATAAALQG